MVAEATGGKLTGGDRVFASVSTDTRTLLPGQLFFAIKGERSDGNAFVAEAARRGAVGAVVTSLQAAELPQVEVADTRIALGRLARAWRRRFTLPVIGVTGSNGKTTVKELIAAIMRETFGGDASRVLMTWGNLNNEIGLPITLMYLTATHGAAVLELGASKPGDIAYLADIAAPTVSVLTNAFPAHLKGFGNLEQVAATKGEIFAALAPSGVAVVNRDDQYYEVWWKRAEGSRRVSFGLHPAADFRAEDIRSKTGPDGPSLEFELVADGNRATVVLPMAGRHNVVNALAAAAAARSAGATHAAIIRGLAATSNVKGRLRYLVTMSGASLYDDSYNANPGSVRAAVEFLAAQPGERWLVLGDMAELGAETDKAHREIGEFVRSLAISRLLCTGASSQHTATGFGPGAEWRSTREELIELLGRPGPGVNILVKGSRSARMEKVVEALAGLTSPATGAH
jgi:UDP-N-acetylmuramoyl-tripeptide--D-alanyl-D-alanine ligase